MAALEDPSASIKQLVEWNSFSDLLQLEPQLPANGIIT
jgi:hypothetical protein